MNEAAMQHIPESKYCFAVNGSEVILRLRISKYDLPKKVYVVYGGKYDFAKKQRQAELVRAYEDRLYAWYTVSLHISDRRLVYIFRIETEEKVWYYSEDGLTENYNFVLNFYNCFQYAYVNGIDIAKPVKWMDNAVFYQIFVDRFCIGNKNKNTAYINMRWGDRPTPKSFAGGDLNGISDKLDYLKGLGINALYLTPIFKSVSNHKYDISDYYKVDSQFGDNAALRTLVSEAHKRGIKIVLDAVFNHCSDRLSQFCDVKENGINSRYRDWFIIVNDDPLVYETFAECSYMPKFNTSNPEVQNFLIDIGTYWIKEFDIDGWRLDVSDEVSHSFWRKFRNAVKSVKPDCILLGENWHDANMYLTGAEFDGIMNYAFTKACLDYFAFGVFNARQFTEKLQELLMRNTDTANNMMLNLLDSHDTDRFITDVKDINKLKCALALEFMFIGAPCLYYGTEIALEGNFDPDSRRTFDWESVDKHKDLAYIIKSLAHLKGNGELCSSDISIIEKDSVIILKRNSYSLVINGSKKAIPVPAGDIVLSSNVTDNTIGRYGFAIVKNGKETVQ